jgi:nucleotide-binding universal stress UspA family protein
MTADRTVLVGTDGSENAGAAVRWAAAEARRRSADLRVVHAYEESWATVPYMGETDLLEIARNHAEEIAADAELIAHAVAPDLTVLRDPIPGDPVVTLLEAARSAGLVVVGNRGHGGFTSLMLGSVGQRIATHAPCPVVVVRGRAAVAEGPVVVGADGSAGGELAVELAFEQAAARECRLVAIRAYMPPLPPSSPNVPPLVQRPEARDAAERRILDEVLAPWRDKYPQVTAEALVARGSAGRVLVGVSHTAQLVVVGSRGHGSLSGTLLGSVGLQLLHHADCPVMIVRR